MALAALLAAFAFTVASVLVPDSAAAKTSIAFCMATAFCKMAGSCAATVIGSPNTLLVLTPKTLLSFSVASVKPVAAPEVIMALARVVSGVMLAEELLASGLAVMLPTKGLPVPVSVPPVNTNWLLARV